LDTTEQPRPSASVLPGRLASSYPRDIPYSFPSVGQISRSAAALLVFLAVVQFAGRFEHPLTIAPPGPFPTFVSIAVPGVAAIVAALAIFRPWHALLLVLALTPFWNAAYVWWQVGSVQIILQTVFVATLAIGAATTRPVQGTFLWTAADLRAAGRSKGLVAFRFAEVGVAIFIGLAVVSTLASHNVTLSATVLLHGILEPIALAAILVFLRPSRRDLVMVGVALGTSVALGSAFNMVETLPRFNSLASLEAHRLQFAYASFYNVGIFAAIVATTVPLVVMALASRRSMSLPTWAVVLIVVSLLVGFAGLFFSLSKSAWIATGGGTVLVLLLVVRSWRRRLAMVVAAVAVSTLFIPWPAFFLQVVPTANTAYRSAMVSLVGESRFDSWNPATLAGRGSMVERFYAAEAGVRMAIVNPVLGVGLDQFGPNYTKPAYRPPAAQDTLDHAHSLFPEIAAELGIAAAALVFVIYAATLWALWRVYRGARDQLTRFLSAGLMASIVAWLVVATAYGCDIYRPDRVLSSDVVLSAVVVGAAVALARAVHTERPWRPAK
jgi:O-antigen ligase